MAWLASIGRGYRVRNAVVPIVPGASLNDLYNGGDKNWGRMPPYWEFGFRAAASASASPFELGTVGAGFGATTLDLKGGLGSTSAATSRGFHVGAVVACNAAGRTTRGEAPHFWAAPYERDGEFGGLGVGPTDAAARETALAALPAGFAAGGRDDDAIAALKSERPASTSLVVVVTDAALTKAQTKRLAVMAQDGLALALRPAHAPTDGDTVFAAATGAASRAPDLRDLTEIGMLAAECVARAVARGVYEATPLGGRRRTAELARLYGR